MPRTKQKKKGKDLIEELAESFPDFYPLPDITPLQHSINILYMKLRICGMPLKQVNIEINKILNKRGITKEQIFNSFNNG